MIDFDKRVQEQAAERDRHMRQRAGIENACLDHAVELEASLSTYVASKAQ
jgi:hypothetical protein